MCVIRIYWPLMGSSDSFTNYEFRIYKFSWRIFVMISFWTSKLRKNCFEPIRKLRKIRGDDSWIKLVKTSDELVRNLAVDIFTFSKICLNQTKLNVSRPASLSLQRNLNFLNLLLISLILFAKVNPNNTGIIQYFRHASTTIGWVFKRFEEEQRWFGSPEIPISNIMPCPSNWIHRKLRKSNQICNFAEFFERYQGSTWFVYFSWSWPWWNIKCFRAQTQSIDPGYNSLRYREPIKFVTSKQTKIISHILTITVQLGGYKIMFISILLPNSNSYSQGHDNFPLYFHLN